jgi:hypothetical protein
VAKGLRKLDMDILRVLAAPALTTHWPRPRALADEPAGEGAMLALFAGSVRSRTVPPGSFNPHFAASLNRFARLAPHDEVGVYHSASANRKVARLEMPHAQICSNQAF